MASISENLEEKIKKSLNYDKKAPSDMRKRFDRLKELCLINNIPMKVKGHFVEAIRIGLYSGSAGVTDGKFNDSQFVWVKPVVRHNKMYLSIDVIKRTIDAAHVDCFGQKIHQLS